MIILPLDSKNLNGKDYIVLPFKFSVFFSRESTGKSKRIHYIVNMNKNEKPKNDNHKALSRAKIR